ncbi:MAG: hypothetical protein V4574_04710 [Pseudomonadota bacterium]
MSGRPTRIEPVDQVLGRGESTSFQVLDEANVIMPLPLPAPWLIQATPPASVLNDIISIEANAPISSKARIEVVNGAGVAACFVEIDILLPWTAKGPRTLDDWYRDGDVYRWEGAKAERARVLLHDVLLQLPDAFTEPLDGLPILLRGNMSGADGEYSVLPPWRSDHIDINRDRVDALDPASRSITPDDRRLAYTFVHEMMHAWLTRKAGTGIDNAHKMAAALAALAGLSTSKGAGLIACVCPPLGVIVSVLGAGSAWGHARVAHDEMSDWCEASDWRQRNLSSVGIPFLGPLLFAVTDELPNVATALAAAADQFWAPIDLLNRSSIDVHNISFDSHRAVTLASAGGYFATPLTAVEIAKGHGPASVYGAMTPMEDCSETFAYATLGVRFRDPPAPLPPVHAIIPEYGNPANLATPKQPTGLDRAGFQLNVTPQVPGTDFFTPSAGRIAYLDARGLVPAKEVIVGGSLLEDFLDMHGVRVAKPAVSDAAIAAAQVELEANGALAAAYATWHAGPAATFSDADRAVAALTDPPHDAARPWSFWSAIECHGDGLQPMDPRGVGADPGDVLLGAGQRILVAATVDETGVRSAVGGVEGLDHPEGIPAEDLALCFRWPPDTRPRTFSPDGAHGRGWSSLEQQLRTVIGWWGESEGAGHQLATGLGFVDALAAVLDLPAPVPIDAHRSDPAALRARLHGLGHGLHPYDGETGARIGDLVILFDRNRYGIVTRLDEHGRPLDVLMGGVTSPGPLGEAAGTARMAHRIDHRDIHFVWTPDAQPRSFAMPDITDPGGLSDPARSLHHLIAHDGATAIQRAEAWIDLTEPLAVLAGLLVEAEPDPARRRAIGIVPSDASASDDAVYRHLSRHGAPTGRPAEIHPGDVLILRDGTAAVAVEAEGGTCTQAARVTETGALAIADVDWSAPEVALSWRPSATPRAVTADADLLAFYGGNIDNLLGLAKRLGTGTSANAALAGATVTVSLSSPTAIATIAAAAAPDWIRARLWEPRDLADLRRACDTLGAGLADGTADARPATPIGTWLFGNSGVEIVLALDSDGRPALVYGVITAFMDHSGVRLHDGRLPAKLWVPSVRPRAYTAGPDGPVYRDRNRLIGTLLHWAARKPDLSGPLFAFSERSRETFAAPVARILSEGPAAAEEWPAYLAEHGAIADIPPEPGDLLLFEDRTRQAVALPEGQMLVHGGSYGPVTVRKIAGVKGVWRPG